MDDKKLLKKIIKSKLTLFAKKHNFKFYKPTILIKESVGILQIINFDILSEGFNCSIAIQPLYIPSDELDLTFGNRLNYFKVQEEGIWGYGNTQEEVEKDLDRVLELLELNATSWFLEVSTPNKIITFINEEKTKDSDSIVGFPPQTKNKFLGYSYLYKGEYSLAVDSFNRFIEFYHGDTRKWVIDEVIKIRALIGIIKNNPVTTLSMLAQYIELTKSNLKIK